MPYYRHTSPSWYGAGTITPATLTASTLGNGLTYLFWNRSSSGSGGAPMGSQVDSGASQFTFGVALGEDATSTSVNRGLKALFENTDYLDEVLQADRIRPVLLSINIPVASTTFTLPADIYLGASGVTLTSGRLQSLLRLCETTGLEVVNFADGYVALAQSCSVATSPLYTEGTEVLTMSIEIPAGDYLLLCYQRTSYATASRTLLQLPVLEGVTALSGTVQLIFSAIRGDGLDLDNEVPASLDVLLRRGMNGIYGLRNVVYDVPTELTAYYPAVTSSNTSGAGAWFVRDGAGLTGLSKNDLSAGTHLKDVLGSIFWANLRDTDPGNGTGLHEFVAGSRGFVATSTTPLSSNAGALEGAGALDMFAAYFESNNAFSDYAYAPTKLVLPLACSVQSVSGYDEVIISGSNWYTNEIDGDILSSLVLGQTLVEVEWANPSDLLSTSTQRRVYRVSAILDGTRMRVLAVDGSKVGFPATLTSATIVRYFTPTFLVSGGVGGVQTLKGNSFASTIRKSVMMSLVPPKASYKAADAVPMDAAYFGASDTANTVSALEWGGYEPNWEATGGLTYRTLGYLRGDGSITSTNISSPLATITTLTATTVNTTALTATGTSTLTTVAISTGTLASVTIAYQLQQRIRRDINSITAGGTTSINLATLLSAKIVGKVTFSSNCTITTMTAPSLGAGDVFEIWFDQTSFIGQISSYTTTWPSSFLFQSEADKLLTQQVGYIDKFKCVCMSTGKFAVEVERVKVSL